MEVQIFSANSLQFTSPAADHQPKQLQVQVAPASLKIYEFIREGWTRVRRPHSTGLHCHRIPVRQLTLVPSKGETVADEKPEAQGQAQGETIGAKLSVDTNEKWYSIDNDKYEVRPISITLLPDVIRVFAPA